MRLPSLLPCGHGEQRHQCGSSVREKPEVVGICDEGDGETLRTDFATVAYRSWKTIAASYDQLVTLSNFMVGRKMLSWWVRIAGLKFMCHSLLDQCA